MTSPKRSQERGERRRLDANRIQNADVREAALFAECVDRSCRDAQVRGDFADRQQTVSKRERKRCQILMTRGIIACRMSSICDSLRSAAIPSDIPIRPFKPRVLGSIPRRLTLQKSLSATQALQAGTPHARRRILRATRRLSSTLASDRRSPRGPLPGDEPPRARAQSRQRPAQSRRRFVSRFSSWSVLDHPFCLLLERAFRCNRSALLRDEQQTVLKQRAGEMTRRAPSAARRSSSAAAWRGRTAGWRGGLAGRRRR